MPINGKADEWIAVYQYKGLVCSSQNEWTAITCTDMIESWWYNSKCKSFVSERWYIAWYSLKS